MITCECAYLRCFLLFITYTSCRQLSDSVHIGLSFHVKIIKTFLDVLEECVFWSRKTDIVAPTLDPGFSFRRITKLLRCSEQPLSSFHSGSPSGTAQPRFQLGRPRRPYCNLELPKKKLGVKPSLVFDYCTNLLMGARFLASSFWKNKLILLHYKGMRIIPIWFVVIAWTLDPSYTLLFASYFLSSFSLHLSVCLLQHNNMRSSKANRAKHAASFGRPACL